MNKYKILLVASVLCGAGGQISMKLGSRALSELGKHSAAVEQTLMMKAQAALFNPWVFLGLLFTGVSMLLWLTVISKIELSFAYPVTSLSYVVVVLVGYFVFKENINAVRIAGVALIMCGVVVISQTGGEG